MTLEEKIRTRAEAAGKSGDTPVRETLKLALSELHNAQIEKRGELSDQEVMGVLRQALKRRREAIELYQRGGRQDLAQKEQKEIEILEEFLPKTPSEAEIDELIAKTAPEVGATGPQDFGKLMGAVMDKLAGSAEGLVVAQKVKKHLG